MRQRREQLMSESQASGLTLLEDPALQFAFASAYPGAKPLEATLRIESRQVTLVGPDGKEISHQVRRLSPRELFQIRYEQWSLVNGMWDDWGTRVDPGDVLSHAFLDGEAGQALSALVHQAFEHGRSLSLGLDIKKPLLMALPWETLRLFTPEGLDPLPMIAHPVVRLYRISPKLQSSPISVRKGPLRILMVSAVPHDYVHEYRRINPEEELERVLDLVEPLRGLPNVQVKYLEGCTRAALEAMLFQERFHVLHLHTPIVGGAFGLENPYGDSDRLLLSELYRDMMWANDNCPLVVMTRSFHNPEKDELSHIRTAWMVRAAQQLVEMGANGALAVPGCMLDGSSWSTVRRFYELLALDPHCKMLPALAQARREVYHEQIQVEATTGRELDLACAGSTVMYVRHPEASLVESTHPGAYESRTGPVHISKNLGPTPHPGLGPSEHWLHAKVERFYTSGLLVLGAPGQGKTTLVSYLREHIKPEQVLVVQLEGEVTPERIYNAIGEQLWVYCDLNEKPDADPLTQASRTLSLIIYSLEERWKALTEHVLGHIPLYLVLDGFEENLTEQGKVRRKGLEELLVALLNHPERSKLIISSRRRFTLPDQLHEKLERYTLDPLGWNAMRLVTWQLPSLAAVDIAGVYMLWHVTAGNPRLLGLLDVLVRKGRIPMDLLQERLIAAYRTTGHRPELPTPLHTLTRMQAQRVAKAAAKVLFEALDDLLRPIPHAKALLYGLSVYRRPVDEPGVKWQVASVGKDGSLGEAPEGWVEARRVLELMGQLDVDLNAPPLDPDYPVDPHRPYRVPSALAFYLRQRMTTKQRRKAHNRAARYWLWRLENTPMSSIGVVETYLEARYHYMQAGQPEDAAHVLLRFSSLMDIWRMEHIQEDYALEALGFLPPGAPITAQFHERVAQGHKNRWEHAKALQSFKKACAAYRKRGQPYQAAAMLRQQGFVSMSRADFVNARKYMRQALGAFTQLRAKDEMASCHYALGTIDVTSEEHDRCLKHFQSYVQLREELKQLEGAADGYHRMGELTKSWGRAAEAQDYYQKSLGYYEQVANLRGMASCQSCLGAIALEQKQWTAAIEYYQKAQQLYERLGNQRTLSSIHHQLGCAMTHTGSVDEALPFTLQSLQVRLALGEAESKTSLVWLARQREMLGEERFEALLFQHAGGVFAMKVLGLLRAPIS